MKKTLTIQLGRSIYPIDEDAYALLEQYLKDYQTHFKLNEADDKVRQLEARIASFFSDKREEGGLVVSLQEVEEVIQMLHESVLDEEAANESQPTDDFEEIDAEECTAQPAADGACDEADPGTADKEARSTDKETRSMGEESGSMGEDSQSADGDARQADGAESQSSAPTPKKLYRNPRDKMVGGVLSGFAAYMGWETTAVRLVFIVFAFLSLQVSVFAYLFSWMLMPLAPRQSWETKYCDKVPFEDVSVKVGLDQQTPTFLQSFCSSVAWIFAFLFKCLLVLMAIFAVPVLLIFVFLFAAYILGAFGVMITVPAFLYSYVPLDDFSINPVGGTLLSVAAVFIIGIPLVALGYAVMHRKNGKEEWSASVRLTLLILWIIAWLVAGAGLFIGIIP